MSTVPLKPLRPADQDAPCPAYAEDASSAAVAESQPFITLSERDIEAASPPAYVENQHDEVETERDDPFKGKSLLIRIMLWLLSIFMFAVGFGGILTMFIVFFKLLVLVWRKLGLL